MDVKEILKLLVSYNTIRDNQNREIMDFIEEYLKSYEDENIGTRIKSLIKKCENYYNVKFNFDNNFLYYPYFKNEGKYSDLTFNI